MEQLDKQERKQLMRVLDKFEMLEGMVQGHHKTLKEHGEWLHFPPDIGPADHIIDHVANKLASKRKGDMNAFLLRSTIWSIVIAVMTLVVMGAKQWILQ